MLNIFIFSPQLSCLPLIMSSCRLGSDCFIIFIPPLPVLANLIDPPSPLSIPFANESCIGLQYIFINNSIAIYVVQCPSCYLLLLLPLPWSTNRVLPTHCLVYPFIYFYLIKIEASGCDNCVRVSKCVE